MTPLEKVAIAISGAPFPSPKSLAKARAALLALAECELPTEIISTAEHAYDSSACGLDGLDHSFKAICRAIASEGGDDVAS